MAVTNGTRRPRNAMAVRATQAKVASETTSGKIYTVTFASCDCEDFIYSRGTEDNPFCKHIVRAYAEVGGWKRATV